MTKLNVFSLILITMYMAFETNGLKRVYTDEQYVAWPRYQDNYDNYGNYDVQPYKPVARPFSDYNGYGHGRNSIGPKNRFDYDAPKWAQTHGSFSAPPMPIFPRFRPNDSIPPYFGGSTNPFDNQHNMGSSEDPFSFDDFQRNNLLPKTSSGQNIKNVEDPAGNITNKKVDEMSSKKIPKRRYIVEKFGIGSPGNMIAMEVRTCCIREDCRVLKKGEICEEVKSETNGQQQNQESSKLNTSSANPNPKVSTNNNDGDQQKNKQAIKPTKQTSFDNSVGSNGESGSQTGGQKLSKPDGYPYSKPTNLSEEEVIKVRNQVLEKTNFYRKKHGIPELTLKGQLETYAQNWANEMVENGFTHRPDGEYGENLYGNSRLHNLGENAVDSWYSEIKQFNINDDENGMFSNTATHHMTQLLWKDSTELGVGVSKTSDGTYYVVANYSPRGNVGGAFKKNLPEITKEDIDAVINKS